MATGGGKKADFLHSTRCAPLVAQVNGLWSPWASKVPDGTQAPKAPEGKLPLCTPALTLTPTPSLVLALTVTLTLTLTQTRIITLTRRKN